MCKIDKLQLITQDIPGKSHALLAEEACKNGIRWIQLRVKNVSDEAWEKQALATREVCKKYGAKLIINDNPHLAAKIQADGIHLGKNDMDPTEARKIAGNNCIIGATANTFEDIWELSGKNIDYIGLGPFRFTSTKDKLSPVLGAEGYKKIIEQCCLNNIALPIIAIGGIIPQDLPALLETGVYGVAVASSINTAENKSELVQAYLNHLNQGVKL
ncbi:MAG: thiamine phosphate synthase [Cytophagaceae bacterium]